MRSSGIVAFFSMQSSANRSFMEQFTERRISRSATNPEKQKAGENILRLFIEKLAATYSRRTYRTTTIGKTVFDGRVRNGIGSDHSFMATKN